jgi:hypothetical protein
MQLVVFDRIKYFSHLLILGFCFLQAQDIRVHLYKIIIKVLLGYSPNSIYVPGDDFHKFNLYHKIGIAYEK